MFVQTLDLIELTAVSGDERLISLVNELQVVGRVDVRAAAARLGTTQMTIRRDLEVLVQRRVARRVRGGAVSLLARGDEIPYWMRALELPEARTRIGGAAAQLLRDGEAVAIDSGTTALECARALFQRRLTVVTVSLRAADLLADSPTIKLILPGGEVRRDERTLVGQATVAGIAGVRLDAVILGACGLADGTVTAYDIGDAAVKQALIDVSARVIVTAQSSKLDRTGMAVVCAADRVDVLVTDAEAPAAALEPWRQAAVEIIRV
jgi:DeoR/GlpR family transcriptional regulator of sugar metabolism